MNVGLGKCSWREILGKCGRAGMVLAVFVCVIVNTVVLQIQAQEGVWAQESQPGQRGQEVSSEADGELLRITRKLKTDQAAVDQEAADQAAEDQETEDQEAVKQAAGLEEPPETYWDRDGNKYVLESWDVKEIPGHMVSRNLEKQVVYTAVEGAEGLPESISATEEVSGAPAEGELYIRDSRTVRQEWQDGFSAPVVFHSYGADEFQVGGMVIGGADVLSQAVYAQEELLAVMGLSADEYRISSMQWDGEAFTDSEGQMCRQAMARGQKLVRDIEITYEGEVSFMEPESYEMEMVYRPVPASVLYVEEETVSGHVQASEPVPVSEENSLWYWVRSGFVITVGAGLIGIGVGVIILIVSWLHRRKWERRQRILPQIKG